MEKGCGWALPKTESAEHDLRMGTHHYFVKRDNPNGLPRMSWRALCGAFMHGPQADGATLVDHPDVEHERLCGNCLRKLRAIGKAEHKKYMAATLKSKA